MTGSTEVGKMLYALCSSTVKRVALELGGNAPFVVFESADVDAAVRGLMKMIMMMMMMMMMMLQVTGLMAAKFRNSGQTCVTANRILVQRPIYQEFLTKFKAKTSELKVTDVYKSLLYRQLVSFCVFVRKIYLRFSQIYYLNDINLNLHKFLLKSFF